MMEMTIKTKYSSTLNIYKSTVVSLQTFKHVAPLIGQAKMCVLSSMSSLYTLLLVQNPNTPRLQREEVGASHNPLLE